MGTLAGGAWSPCHTAPTVHHCAPVVDNTPIVLQGGGWAGLARLAGLGRAGLGWASMGHRRDGDSMVCRDAGSRDHMSHACMLQCCMLHASPSGSCRQSIDRLRALSRFGGWWCMAVLSWWSDLSG